MTAKKKKPAKRKSGMAYGYSKGRKKAPKRSGAKRPAKRRSTKRRASKR